MITQGVTVEHYAADQEVILGEPGAIAAAVIVAIATIIGALIGGDVMTVSPGPAIQPSMASSAPPPATSPQPPVAAGTPTTLEEPTASTSSDAGSEVMAYVDDYAQECRVGALTTGTASINGIDYAHTILQWAGDTSQPVTIKRNALRFQATVGIRDDASDQVRAQFELRGDNGQQLFKSRILRYGESQKVDVQLKAC